MRAAPLMRTPPTPMAHAFCFACSHLTPGRGRALRRPVREPVKGKPLDPLQARSSPSAKRQPV